MTPENKLIEPVLFFLNTKIRLPFKLCYKFYMYLENGHKSISLYLNYIFILLLSVSV